VTAARGRRLPATAAGELVAGLLFGVPVTLARDRQPGEDIDEIDHHGHADQEASGCGRDASRSGEDHDHAGKQNRGGKTVADQVDRSEPGHTFKVPRQPPVASYVLFVVGPS
jgi:hypothetical protein